MITTIGILEKHQAEDNCIKDLLHQLQESLKKSEEDMKKNVVFENDSLPARDVDSLIKLQQQYLKHYQVPVQYRKIFGLVINRLNNFYQIKTNLFKKAQKNNNEAFDQLINSDQTTKDILYHINGLITHKDLSRLFDQKWTQKQVTKTERIQLFCLGKKKVFLPHNQINKNQQMILDL